MLLFLANVKQYRPGYSIQSTFRDSLTAGILYLISSAFSPQALVNFIRKQAHDLFLDIIVIQKQREEVLVLAQSFDQSIVDTVIV